MKCKYLFFGSLLAFLLMSFNLFAQTPQSFNYQAVIRNSSGEPITNQNVGIQISILQGSSTGTPVYIETHDVSTNDYGIVALKVGNGTATSGDFAGNDWSSGSYFIEIAIDESGGTAYQKIGAVQLLSVPYALFAENVHNKDDADADSTNEIQTISIKGDTLELSDGGKVVFPYDSSQWIISGDKMYYNGGNVGVGTNNPQSRLDIKSDETSSALFQVINANNDTVFAVYPDGVKVFVDQGTKGNIGGFAVSGRTNNKSDKVDYLKVTPDSTRIFVNEISGLKGKIGGFAVSGRTNTKGIVNDYLFVTPDSTRIYVNDTATTKGNIGGFAVSGRTTGKGQASKFLDMTKDNYFIGHEAGRSNTTGVYNSFFGYKAGYSNTTGNRNTFMGYFAGHNNSAGFSNIFIGDSAGYDNDTGIYNVFIGNGTGRSNISGRGNVFIGSTTGFYNETGNQNVFVGNWCGFYNIDGYRNVFIGNRSGWNNTYGNKNVFIGNESGFGNIDGRYNVIIGDKAGYSNTSGGGNVIIGSTAGELNTTGYYNVFLGNWCGRSNTTGHENIFLGNLSGWYNTEGYKNIFIGSYSGFQNDSGSNNIFFGDSAGYTNIAADNNIFIGNKSGFANVDGSRNVFLGYQSGYSNQAGYNNVFLGNNSGFSNTAGYKNIFIGDSAGYLSTNMSFNIFIGDKVGYHNTEGYGNVIIGATAGKNNTTGRNNTFVGNWSGFYNTTGERNLFLGDQAGWNNIAGSRNVYIGNRAGYNNTEGWNNVFIGNYAGFNEKGSGKLYIDVADTDSTNTLIWGDFTNNKVRINGMLGINKHPEYNTIEAVYNSGSANIMLQGTGNSYSYSKVILMSDEVTDKRWDIMHSKSNFFELSYNNGTTWYNGLLKVDTSGNLIAGGSVVPFIDDADSLGNTTNRWNVVFATNGTIQTSDIRLKTNIAQLGYGISEIMQLNPVLFNWKGKENGKKNIGLIAQEVDKIIEEVVNHGKDPDKTLGINYAEIIPVLIKGMQEQQETINNQQKLMNEQQKQIDELNKIVEQLYKITSNY